MDYAPLARIVLRYLVGAGIMGSDQIGDALAADPDLILYVSLAIGAVVEGGYALAKRKGWAT
jgi:preprotein translocase subunit Sec61beta